MKKITGISILFILILLNGCTSQDEKLIKKDLESRFTKFEIVEVKKDSANVDDAFNMLLSLKVNISIGNLDITKAEARYYNYDGLGKWSLTKTENYMDSVTKKLTKLCHNFMILQFDKSEPCYYVKFRIYNGVFKEERAEYYYVRKYGSNNELTELMRRPYIWKDYLLEENVADIYDKCTEKYLSFLKEIAYGN
jgi:hypothetical protein